VLPHRTVLILQEQQLGHPRRVSFLEGGEEVSLGGSIHILQEQQLGHLHRVSSLDGGEEVSLGGSIHILQEQQLGHPHRVSFLVGGEVVSFGGCYHIEQFLSYKNYSWDIHTGFPFLRAEKRGVLEGATT
jgi:hypothetical protein